MELVTIFKNKTGKLKKVKVSIKSKSVQNNTLAIKVYRKNTATPKLFTPGRKASSKSRKVTKRSNELRKKAKQVHAAAFIPGVLPKTSIVSPNIKAQSINWLGMGLHILQYATD